MTDPAAADLVAALARAGVPDVSASTLDRALYSSDASLYRVVPAAVAHPRHPDELLAILEVARESGTPLTMRGAGTSIAGNAVGPGLVVDTSRWLDRILALDPEARTATVQPGVVHAALQREAAAHGLRYGPDPSTHTRCTIGGMIGNNACGSRALGYGRTADNIAGMRVAFGTGEVATLGAADDSVVGARLAALAEDHLGHLRTGFGQFSRQVSGYSLEHLLPERRRLDRFLVGSEGTLGLVLDATVELVPDEPRDLVVLGFRSIIDAADAVPALLAAPLIACEGLDARIVELVEATGRQLPALPRGRAWLLVEVPAGEPVPAAGEVQRLHVRDAAQAAALWRIREDGAGLAARSLDRPAYSGWEDAAVPPEHLGAWLRDFDQLLLAHGLHGVPYGHFGDGCVHVRIDFPLGRKDGQRRFRDFLTESARALAAYGGSLSGEHGDGRARSELLPLMYGEESLRLFGAVKAVCDPDGLLNPGVLVDPAPLDADLRPARPVREPRTALRLVHDGGSLGAAVHRCTGVGKCVAPAPTGLMCPSFLATREESASTRGRARVLQEALDGTLVAGLADPAVAEALDLCLACKGCASDCPTGVDMATYKAEVLHQTWAGKRRPRSHRTLGRLPEWLRRSRRLPAGWLDRALGFETVARLARAAAGVDQRRSLPRPAVRTLREDLGGAPEPAPGDATAAEESVLPDVWIWADTFTDHLAPGNGHATIELLAKVGLTARVIGEDACCGLTWITTGQLDEARTKMAATVAVLAAYVDGPVPVIGLEPSCLATLRSDAVQLVADPAARRVATGVLTLAEYLCGLPDERLGFLLPDLTGVRVVAQPHCHQQAIIGWDADERLLRRAGAEVTRVPGCCGLAGSFGMERGHYEVSVAVAETALLPAVRAARAADPATVVLADGLSCRVQLDDLAGVEAVHLAELLLAGAPGSPT